MSDNGKPAAPHTGTEFEGPQGLDALPGLARLALAAWLHSTEWAVKNSVKVPRLVIEVAASPSRAIELVRELGSRLPDPTQPDPDQEPEHPQTQNGNRSLDDADHERLVGALRREGEELLRRSRDVHLDVDSHPAYERIMGELAPDEARILRLLLFEGPQASVDVRTGGPLGMLRSELIAPGLSMIGARAGCRYVQRIPSYLNNLFRLGMVWFSRETLHDPQPYQVLEAQPEVQEALKTVRHAKVVRRSIHLTPFGEDFCRVCLVPEEEELEELPAHSTPQASDGAAAPPSGALAERSGD